MSRQIILLLTAVGGVVSMPLSEGCCSPSSGVAALQLAGAVASFQTARQSGDKQGILDALRTAGQAVTNMTVDELMALRRQLGKEDPSRENAEELKQLFGQMDEIIQAVSDLDVGDPNIPRTAYRDEMAKDGIEVSDSLYNAMVELLDSLK